MTGSLKAWREVACTLAGIGMTIHLTSRHTRKPFEKLIDRRSILKILEEGLHRHTGAKEDPSSAHLGGLALHFGAFRPVDHW